jgi:hypothetical protein
MMAAWHPAAAGLPGTGSKGIPSRGLLGFVPKDYRTQPGVSTPGTCPHNVPP